MKDQLSFLLTKSITENIMWFMPPINNYVLSAAKGNEVDNKQKKLRSLVILGLMTAAVFASNYIQFVIPTPIGATRIHIANGICLLSALLMGGFKGGISAGLGSFLFDLTFPEYVATSWVTFIMKFLMALICGFVVHISGKDNTGSGISVLRKIVGAVIGSVSYVVMYIAKQFIEQCLILGLSVQAVAITTFTVKLPASLINAALAVPIAVLLHSALYPALKKAGLSDLFGIK